ncbi:MAG: class I SAM-dependent methyltransferase, partial [Candidatus Omnitrophica bacterium]|nr:class I SAM-dependent methyltransferase [Candidatus Omnitrophota bacterium]
MDQYGDCLVFQSRTAGLEPWKPVVVDLLRSALHPAGILERSDKEFRDAEALPAVTQVHAGRVPERVRIEEDGLAFWVDPHRGQKTGFYLDQRDTRAFVRGLIRPGERVADVFAYTGSFGIGAAARGARVV